MPLYAFRCRDKHETEALRPQVRTMISCPECGLPAHRLSAYRIARPPQIESVEMSGADFMRRHDEASAELDYEAAKRESVVTQSSTTIDGWTVNRTVQP